VGGLGGAGVGGDAGTDGKGGAMAGAGGGTPMVPVQGCVVDGGGMCIGSPELILNVPGCGKLQLAQAAKSLFVLSIGTRQLFSLSPGAAVPLEVPTTLSDGVTEALPTAFWVASGEGYVFVAVGLALLRVDQQLGSTEVHIREREPIVDVSGTVGFVKYAHAATVTNLQAYSEVGSSTGEISTEVDGGRPSAIVANGAVVWANSGSFSVKVQAGNVRTIGTSQASLIFGHRALQVDHLHAFWMSAGLKRANLLLPDELRNVLVSPNGELVAFTVGYQRESNVDASQVYVATSSGTIELGVIAADSAADPALTTVVARDMGTVSELEIDSERVFVATADCNVTAFPRRAPPP
jgi:hypothetical protein